MATVSTRSRRGRRTISEINMVPFIDVMLVLLIIFMVTAPLLAPSLIEVPSIGKASAAPDQVITIEITRKGRLNLHKFDAKMQAQLEGYLVALGILNAGQTLSANEQQPGEDAFQSEPAFQE